MKGAGEMKVGFIGLGHLGRAMAERLISQGVELVVWNRTKSKARGLSAATGESPAEVVSESELVFLNLFDSEAAAEVLLGESGVISGDCHGKVIIDTTTNNPEAVPEFYEMVAEAGGEYVESPIFGSVVPAAKGVLTIVVSGTETAYKRALPLLEKLGRNIFYLKQPTLASRMKLINNMVLGSFMATIAEATACGEAAGIGRSQVLEILAAGAGNSGVLNAKKQALLDEEFAPQFSVDAIYKDLHYLQDLARELKRPLFMGGLARELFGLARSKGLGELDFSAIFKAVSAK
jgi:3-hydroxyisobutyrate dehydrogenase